jgi:hypothetical protein
MSRMARTASDTAARSADSSCKVELMNTRNRWSGVRMGDVAVLTAKRQNTNPGG